MAITARQDQTERMRFRPESQRAALPSCSCSDASQRQERRSHCRIRPKRLRAAVFKPVCGTPITLRRGSRRIEQVDHKIDEQKATAETHERMEDAVLIAHGALRGCPAFRTETALRHTATARVPEPNARNCQGRQNRVFRNVKHTPSSAKRHCAGDGHERLRHDVIDVGMIPAPRAGNRDGEGQQGKRSPAPRRIDEE